MTMLRHFIIVIVSGLIWNCKPKPPSKNSNSGSLTPFFGEWESACLLKTFEGRSMGLKAKISIFPRGFKLVTHHYHRTDCQDPMFSETHEGTLEINSNKPLLRIEKVAMALVDDYLVNEYQKNSILGLNWQKGLNVRVPNTPRPGQENLGVIRVGASKALEFFPGSTEFKGMPMVFLKDR